MSSFKISWRIDAWRKISELFSKNAYAQTIFPTFLCLSVIKRTLERIGTSSRFENFDQSADEQKQRKNSKWKGIRELLKIFKVARNLKMAIKRRDNNEREHVFFFVINLWLATTRYTTVNSNKQITSQKSNPIPHRALKNSRNGNVLKLANTWFGVFACW